MVLDVDLITHLYLGKTPLNVTTRTAQILAFTDPLPDDHAPELLLACDQRADAPLMPEQEPNHISGGVIMDDAMLRTLSLSN